MRCNDCGDRADPVNGVFTCVRCGYAKPVPVMWQLVGHEPLAPRYRPAVDVVVVNVWGEQISAGKL